MGSIFHSVQAVMLPDFVCRSVFIPVWVFHGIVARGRFSLPAPAPPHDRQVNFRDEQEALTFTEDLVLEDIVHFPSINTYIQPSRRGLQEALGRTNFLRIIYWFLPWIDLPVA